VAPSTKVLLVSIFLEPGSFSGRATEFPQPRLSSNALAKSLAKRRTRLATARLDACCCAIFVFSPNTSSGRHQAHFPQTSSKVSRSPTRRGPYVDAAAQHILNRDDFSTKTSENFENQRSMFGTPRRSRPASVKAVSRPSFKRHTPGNAPLLTTRFCDPPSSTHSSCSEGGQHRVDNGLLLRSDVHTMFDRGYIGVDEEFGYGSVRGSELNLGMERSSTQGRECHRAAISHGESPLASAPVAPSKSLPMIPGSPETFNVSIRIVLGQLVRAEMVFVLLFAVLGPVVAVFP